MKSFQCDKRGEGGAFHGNYRVNKCTLKQQFKDKAKRHLLKVVLTKLKKCEILPYFGSLMDFMEAGLRSMLNGIVSRKRLIVLKKFIDKHFPFWSFLFGLSFVVFSFWSFLSGLSFLVFPIWSERNDLFEDYTVQEAYDMLALQC